MLDKNHRQPITLTPLKAQAGITKEVASMELLNYGHGCAYFALLLIIFHLIFDLVPLLWSRLHDAFVSALVSVDAPPADITAGQEP